MEDFTDKKYQVLLRENRLIPYNRPNGQDTDHNHQHQPAFSHPQVERDVMKHLTQLHRTTSRGIPRYFDRTFISIIENPSFGRGVGDNKGSENGAPNGLCIYIVVVISGISCLRKLPFPPSAYILTKWNREIDRSPGNAH